MLDILQHGRQKKHTVNQTLLWVIPFTIHCSSTFHLILVPSSMSPCLFMEVNVCYFPPSTNQLFLLTEFSYLFAYKWLTMKFLIHPFLWPQTIHLTRQQVHWWVWAGLYQGSSCSHWLQCHQHWLCAWYNPLILSFQALWLARASQGYHPHKHEGIGQSCGAFLAPGVTIELKGDSNDYVSKGLSSCHLIMYPPKVSTFKAEENVIVGNLCLYGTTSDEAFIWGITAERSVVHNSGMNTVIKWVYTFISHIFCTMQSIKIGVLTYITDQWNHSQKLE